MLKLNVKNETSRLRAVVLGTAKSNGPTPSLGEAYDPKSAVHIKAGTYPVEADMVKEMEAVATIFKKYDVKVYRPELIEDCNQIFARDIAFVIDDVFVKANILPDRENELDAIQYIIDQVSAEKVIRPPEEVHIEGGDVMPWNDYIFVGTYREDEYSDCIVARTNVQGVEFLEKTFPNKKVKSFNLRKSQTNPRDNALHLDCCFQPIGTNKAILHKEGFLEEEEYEWLLNYFGKENCFIISKEEMYNMNSNIFSISEDVIISEKNFTRLNTWLRDNGFTVEEVPYAEISKQEGLLRCSTMPLIRD
ncbi:dimethylarginine dimethylaminohydrolase family protein [Lacinutrix sp. Bg11-31]|uniref:dimethylarginine dimethylaminohydrolase family protein n=1 Tax=Lacinutrix sp. Bg11-31 TaxID=2057808 RepID=UPI000C318A95|nr:arginine deiminase family protein [Lacinutrix sp. Bg11-31]AUC82304.1 amidinotransferase [Lacinutrix sp. Bg11-31]